MKREKCKQGMRLMEFLQSDGSWRENIYESERDGELVKIGEQKEYDVFYSKPTTTENVYLFRKKREEHLCKVEEGGFFDNVTTWEEAIEKLKEAKDDCPLVGEFVEIGGKVYFDLDMENNASWYFSKGKLLTTNKKEGEE